MAAKAIVYNNNGKIELIIGPMFSSKSTTLLARIRRYKAALKECIIINHSSDNERYKDEYNGVRTHNDDRYEPSISRNVLSLDPKEKDIYKNVDVIGIDEGQWFTDIVSFSEEMANRGIIIIIAALDGTFAREPFNNILKLIPLSEKVTKLTAKCNICTKTAAFTKRIGNSTEVNLPGGADSYMACCRSCYLNDIIIVNITENVCTKVVDISINVEEEEEEVKKESVLCKNDNINKNIPFSLKQVNKLIIPSLKRTLSNLSDNQSFLKEDGVFEVSKKQKVQDIIGKKEVEISMI